MVSGGAEEVAHRLADLGSRIRYGVPFEEKARMALTGRIPGSRPVRSELEAEIEQRRAAAYLFAKQWPGLGPEWQPLIDRLRRGDDPRVLAVTQDAAEQGAQDAMQARRSAPAPPSWLLEVK